MPPKTTEIAFGKHLLRIAETERGWEGIVVGDSGTRFSAPDKDTLVRKLTDHALAQVAEFVGHEGARARFLELFPQGFPDPGLVARELSEKREATEWLNREAPLDAALAGRADPAVVLRAIQRGEQVDKFGKTKVAAVLRGNRGKRLVTLLAQFADGEIAGACAALDREFHDDGIATWPIVTFPAFCWRPDTHCFLKPEFSKEYARRIGHRFAIDYASRPNPDTYRVFLDMLEETRVHIADLGPRDYIDLHSFMWAVTKYTEEGPVAGS